MSLFSRTFLLTAVSMPRPAHRSPQAMLSCMNDVDLISHAAGTMFYHHDSDTRTIVAYLRGLQGSCERWTVPTSMDGRGAVALWDCKG